MRLVRLMTPSLVLAASAVLVSCAQQAGVIGPDTKNVNLQVGCSGDTVSFTLSPWRLAVAQGDAIEWHLTVTTGRVPEFGVEPVQGGRWLYVDTARIPGNPQRPARAQEMHRNASGNYRYQVDLTCADSVTGNIHSVVVDPDVVVE